MITPSIRISMLSYSQITTFCLCSRVVSDGRDGNRSAYLLQVLEDDILSADVRGAVCASNPDNRTHDGLNHHPLLTT